MTFDLQPFPPIGARVAPGSLDVTLAGVPAGYVAAVIMGTTIGDSDIGSESLSGPGTVNFTVPSGVTAVYMSVCLDYGEGGDLSTYQWVYGVGTCNTGIAATVQDALVGYIEEKFRRSMLATFEDNLCVPDRGDHGFDQICPITVGGIAFNPASDDDCAPFTAAQVQTLHTGTGYLILDLRPFGDPEVQSPGCAPRLMQRFVLDIQSRTPKDGPYLPNAMHAAMASILRYLYLPINDGRLEYISNTDPPTEFAEDLGDDGKWQWYGQSVTFEVHYIGNQAGAPA